MVKVMLRKLRKLLSRSMYEEYWKTDRGSYGKRFVGDVCREFEFDSVLDAGCGEGSVVRSFLGRGKDAYGVELSREALSSCRDLVRANKIKNASLVSMAYPDKNFDLVFSSEVLEHIPEKEVILAIKEICRVSRRYVFATISLRPSSNNNAYHPTLRSRAWWEKRFRENGFRPMRTVIEGFQEIMEGASNAEVLLAGPTKSHYDELAWFVEDEPYSLHGELEPWFFIFERVPN